MGEGCSFGESSPAVMIFESQVLAGRRWTGGLEWLRGSYLGSCERLLRCRDELGSCEEDFLEGDDLVI
jgi:hypothetical protein